LKAHAFWSTKFRVIFARQNVTVITFKLTTVTKLFFLNCRPTLYTTRRPRLLHITQGLVKYADDPKKQQSSTFSVKILSYTMFYWIFCTRRRTSLYENITVSVEAKMRSRLACVEKKKAFHWPLLLAI